MPNDALRSRIWVDTFTALCYRMTVDDAGGVGDPDAFIDVSHNDGKTWRRSSEFRSVGDFVQAIREQRLSMHFEPQADDLMGVKFILTECKKQLSNNKLEHNDKQRKGELKAYQKIAGICADYLSKVRSPEPEPAPIPAEAATDVSADALEGDEDAEASACGDESPDSAGCEAR